jgi:hypothetical protein
LYNDTAVTGGQSYEYKILSKNELGPASANSTAVSAMVANALIITSYESDGTTDLDGSISVRLFNDTFSSTLTGDGQGRTSFPELSGDYNFTITHIDTNYIINKTLNNVTVPFDSDVLIDVSTDVKRVNCPSNGPSNDFLILVNSSSPVHFISNFTNPVCASDDKVTWQVLFSNTTSSTVSSFTTQMTALVLSLGDFGNNAKEFVVNGTLLPTSFASPLITSDPIVVSTSKPDALIVFDTLFLQEEDTPPAPAPSPTVPPNPQPGGTPGGGTPAQPIRFFEELFGFSLFAKLHQLSVGQIQDGTIDITWNSPEPITIESIQVGEQFITWIGFPNQPFTIDGSDRISTGKIPYRIMPPADLCEEVTGQTINCVDRILYEIPVKIFASVEGQPLTANSTIKVNLSLDITLALFTIFIAFAGGIGAIIYRSAIVSKSQKRDKKKLKTKSKERKIIESRFAKPRSKLRRRP